MKLKDKVAIVTGGAGSIGQAICRQLAAEGAVVAVVDLDQAQAQAVADALGQSGARAIAVAVNVRERESVGQMVQAVRRELGDIDILVNSAGGSARQPWGPFYKCADETFDRVLGVNLLGTAYCIRAVIERMVERRAGTIVNIASIVALQGSACTTDYAAAKGGVIAMSKSLAIELGEFGIRVNCVSPGLVPRPDQDAEAMRSTNYLNAICTPDDIANVVRFLATDEARFITGQNYIVDGGRSLGLTKK